MTKPTIDDIEKWINFYYQTLNLEHIPRIIEGLHKEQKLADQHVVISIMYFLSLVFRANPNKIIEWVTPFFKVLSTEEKKTLIGALWLSNTPIAATYLNSIIPSIPELASYLKNVHSTPFCEIEEEPIEFPYVLDALWAAFAATGQEQYIIRIITALNYSDSNNEAKKLISSMAKWVLSSNIKIHLKVREICIEQTMKQPANIKVILEKMIIETVDS